MAFSGIAAPDNVELVGAVVDHRKFDKINGNQDLRHYLIGGRIGSQRKEMVSNGTTWVEEVDLRDDGEAQVIGSYGEVGYGAPVNKQQLSVRIVNFVKGWMVDDFEVEDARQGGNAASVLFSLTDSKRLPAFRAMFRTKDRRFFQKPVDGSDPNTLAGLQTWCCAADAATAAGQRGDLGIRMRYQDGNTEDEKGGIAGDTESKWRNPVNVIATNGGQELTDALRWISLQVDFSVPGQLATIEMSFKPQWEIFVGVENYLLARRLADAGGSDFTFEGGRLMWQGSVPVTRVEDLDQDIIRPWFFVNWSYWDIGCRPGVWFKEVGNGAGGGGLRTHNRPFVQHWNIVTRMATRCRNVRKGCGMVHLTFATDAASLVAG